MAAVLTAVVLAALAMPTPAAAGADPMAADSTEVAVLTLDPTTAVLAALAAPTPAVEDVVPEVALDPRAAIVPAAVAGTIPAVILAVGRLLE